MSIVIPLPRFRYLIEPQSISQLGCISPGNVKNSEDTPSIDFLFTHNKYTNCLNTALAIAINNPYVKSVYDQENSTHILIKRVLS